MKLNTHSILNQLDQLGVALEDRSYLLSVAFARAIAYRLSIPTSAVENPYAYFTETHRAAVDMLLGELNERVVLDMDATLDLVSRIWTFRYRMVYDARNPALRQFLDALIKVGSREIPPKVSEWMIRYQDSDAVEAVAKFLESAITEEG